MTPAKNAPEVEDDGDEEEAPFYCPGCGKRFQREGECTGTGEAPHPPIEVVSTDELSGEEGHTAAPGTAA
jgi:hypothetical protein